MARLATPHFNDTATPNVASAIFYCKPGILGDLKDGLKKIDVAKNKQKEVYDTAMEETQCIEICVKAEVEKKHLDIEKELDVHQLTLEEGQQEFRERIALEAQKAQEAQRYNPHIKLPSNPHSRYASIN